MSANGLNVCNFVFTLHRGLWLIYSKQPCDQLLTMKLSCSVLIIEEENWYYLKRLHCISILVCLQLLRSFTIIKGEKEDKVCTNLDQNVCTSNINNCFCLIHVSKVWRKWFSQYKVMLLVETLTFNNKSVLNYLKIDA